MSASFEKRNVTLQTAQGIVMAAAKKTQEIGIPMAIAVVDPDGALKAFAPMDGAALLSGARCSTEGMDRCIL